MDNEDKKLIKGLIQELKNINENLVRLESTIEETEIHLVKNLGEIKENLDRGLNK